MLSQLLQEAGPNWRYMVYIKRRDSVRATALVVLEHSITDRYMGIVVDKSTRNLRYSDWLNRPDRCRSSPPSAHMRRPTEIRSGTDILVYVTKRRAAEGRDHRQVIVARRSTEIGDIY